MTDLQKVRSKNLEDSLFDRKEGWNRPFKDE